MLNTDYRTLRQKIKADRIADARWVDWFLVLAPLTLFSAGVAVGLLIGWAL